MQYVSVIGDGTKYGPFDDPQDAADFNRHLPPEIARLGSSIEPIWPVTDPWAPFQREADV